MAPPHFYVSHSWAGNFADMVDALVACVAVRVPKMTPEETYVWIGEL